MSSSTHVAVPGSHRSEVPGAQALRPTDPNAEADVTLKLRRRAPLPEIGPGRPQVLSAAELESSYGASPADMDLVAKTLEGYGLRVIDRDLANRSLCAKGTIANLERAFDVKLFDYQSDRGDYRGRTGLLHVPTELDGIVEGVFGLDTRRVVRRRHGRQDDHQQRSDADEATKARQPAQYASQLAELYNFPPGDASGQTIGLIEFGGGYFPSDLVDFCQMAGSPTPTVNAISVDGAATNLHDGQEDEVMLDIEVVASGCPKATINVYFSAFDEQGWIDVIDRALKDAPTCVSVSWGLAEDDPQWSASAVQAISDALHQAALQGITFLIASGDDGSYDEVNDGLAHVDFPSASPYVLAVGGTQLTASGGKITSEVAWKQGTGRRPSGGSTGGGVSQLFQRPAWQSVSIASVNPHPIDGRVVPDVAALAGSPDYAVYIDGAPSAVGGTSAATPLWACLLCRLIANLPAGKQLPFVTPLLYQSDGTTTVGAAGCNDITKGNNDTATAGGYSAGPGFDAVTGWGTPNGSRLLDALTTALG